MPRSRPRIPDRQLPYRSAPTAKTGAINHRDDGRDVYFDDPNFHLLEIITCPYGSAGTGDQHPHSVVFSTIE